MADKIFNIVLYLILVATLIYASFFIFGCNSGWTWPGQKPKQIISPETPQQQLWHTIKKSNWLSHFTIPIIALGAVAMFNGAAKLGMSAIIYGCVNLFVSLATARFGLWMAIFGLMGSGLAVAASILSKNRVIVEAIKGIQKYKGANSLSPVSKDQANKILAKEQSPATQKIVQDVKTKLKLRGEI